MNKIFKTKNFVIIVSLLFILSIASSLISESYFLGSISGNCNFCGRSANNLYSGLPLCPLEFIPCSEVYGSLISFTFGLFLVLYLLAYIIYKLIHRKNSKI